MRAKASRRPEYLVLRREQLRELGRTKLGLPTLGCIAQRLDMDRASLSDLIHGHVQPSGRTIAAMLALYGEPFEALFEVRTREAA